MRYEDTIGMSTKRRISSWYSSKKRKKCLILMGRSGNGKTTLPKALAESLDIDIQIIGPDEMQKDILKSINTTFQENKIILVDDFDHIHFSRRGLLYDIMKYSRFPIIVTCTEWKFKGEMFGQSEIVKIKKPMEHEIVNLLVDTQDISKELARDIAKNCNSVKEAINCSQTGLIPTKENIYISSKDKLEAIKKRDMKRKIEKSNVAFYFWSIRGYGKNSIQAMQLFSDYDYLTHSRYERIDPFLVNNTPKPIEKVEWKYKQRKKEKSK